MTLNPEFRRNLWLELTAARFLGLGAVIVLCIAALEAGDRLGDFAGGYVYIGKAGFFLTAVLWGTRRVAVGMGAEVRSATWDWQRLSSMGPWRMTWGKLLGPSIFTWLAGSIFLALMVLGYLRGGGGAELSGPFFSGEHFSLELASMLLDALLAQSVTLLACLIFMRKRRPARDLPIALCQALGLVVYISLGGGVGSLTNMIGVSGTAGSYLDTVAWYDLTLSSAGFLLSTKLFFASAAVIACYRMMKEELQLATVAWGWAAFLLLVGLYLHGLIVPSCAACGEVVTLPLALFFAVFALGAYAALFADRKEPLELSYFLEGLRGRTPGALQRMPLWLPSFALALILGVAAALTGAKAAIGPAGEFAWAAWRLDSFTQPLAFSLLALMVRDFALVLGLAFGGQGRRVDLIAVFWLALLYFLLPATLQAMGMTGLAGIFAPPLSIEPTTALLGAGGQAALALAWAIWRWRATMGRFRASLPDGVPKGS
ncbi:hypothetical protein [Limibacillus halophilus]